MVNLYKPEPFVNHLEWYTYISINKKANKKAKVKAKTFTIYINVGCKINTCNNKVQAN